MLQFKYIHKNDGYDSLFSTNDEGVCEELELYINQLNSISSLQNQPVYAYLCDDKYGIYYKGMNANINALFDPNNSFLVSNRNAYSVDVMFNETFIVVDNSEANVGEKNPRPVPFILPVVRPTEMSHACKVVDAILMEKKVAVVGKAADQIKNFIKFVLYLLPTSYANKVGYVVNCSYVPDIYETIFNSVKLIGMINADSNFSGVDLVVNLNENLEEEVFDTEFAKMLFFNKSVPTLMHRKSKEMANLFTIDGIYDSANASFEMAFPIFEVNKTPENALRVLDVLIYQGNNISLPTFDSVANYVLENELYDGDIASKIDTIILNNKELSSYKLRFKGKTVTQYLLDTTKLTKVQVAEIIDYFAVDEVEFSSDHKNILLEQRESSNTYDILFGIATKSHDEQKKALLFDFLSVDRTYDIKIDNLRFNEVIIKKILEFQGNERVELLARFLYSSVLIRQREKNFSKIRKNDFLSAFSNIKKTIKDNELIIAVYDRIRKLLETYEAANIIEYHEFELFDDEQLSLLVKVNRKNEEKEYYELLSFVTESDCGLYTRFQKIIINNILGQDFEGKNYYEKYINVNNLNEFKRFFTYTNTEISGLIATFIKGLEVETDAADLLAPYRLDFVYNTYITAAISVREKIANRLGVAIDAKMDEAIKAIIFNENGKNDILKRAKQKDAIDSIISMVKKDDEIRIDGKLLSSKYTLLAIFVGFIFTLIGLLFFLSPIITKTIMLGKDFFEVFFSLYNQLTPLIMLYSFIFFVISYLINVKKARGYVGQAIWLTIKKWFIYVLLPIILYALTYILIYCLI